MSRINITFFFNSVLYNFGTTCIAYNLDIIMTYATEQWSCTEMLYNLKNNIFAFPSSRLGCSRAVIRLQSKSDICSPHVQSKCKFRLTSHIMFSCHTKNKVIRCEPWQKLWLELHVKSISEVHWVWQNHTKYKFSADCKTHESKQQSQKQSG